MNPGQPETRQLILDRIRGNLPQPVEEAATAYAAIPRSYVRQGLLRHEAVVSLFIDRLVDYDAEVVRSSEAGIVEAVARLLAAAGETRLAVPADIDWGSLPTGLNIVQDGPLLATGDVEGAQAVLTPCEVAIASTGTIVLCHGPQQGRRILTLLPDHHLCVVRESQIVETVPEAFARIQGRGSGAITTISGPSATSDIEMTRIRGVHGPRRLSVILVR
jgi:L-lactate dehydrogenase complex protein LldG